MKINQFFDKAFYINLDKRIDRRETFENELSKYGLLDFVERIPAEDGTHLENPRHRYPYLSLSYQKIFERFKIEKYERILIFEDDAYFIDNEDYKGIEVIEKCLDDLSIVPNWDLFYFGGYPREFNFITPNLAGVDYILGTHAIGYNRKSIDTLLTLQPFADPVIDVWLTSLPNLEKYVAYPISVPQTGGVSGYSDLDGFGNAPGIDHFRNIYNKAEKNNYEKFY
jgi:hypothetical protein